jgi:hypothetical protein
VRVTVSTGHDATWPDVAYNSQIDQYLVVWKAHKSTWGRRVDARGEPRGTAFEIASGPTIGDGQPEVAYDSKRNRYLVIWGRADGLVYQMYGRFVPWDGPDPALPPFAIDPARPASTDLYALAYGSTPDEFLVVWANKDAGSGRDVIAGRRVKGAGGFAAGTFLIAAGSPDSRGNPDVAYNDQRNQYLVVYDNYPESSGEDIYATRLSATGSRMGGGEFAIASWPGQERGPSVASCTGSDQYLVGWHGLPTPGDGFWVHFVSGLGGLGSVLQLEDFDWWVHHRPLDVACGVTGMDMEDPRYVATWGISFDLEGNTFAHEIRPNGALSERLELGHYTSSSAVAGGAINSLVAWETEGTDPDPESDIYASIVGNTKPTASFTVTPAEGNSTRTFSFDASASRDATDPPSQLQVRWDWDDGTGTSWSHERTATHKFPLDAGLLLNLYSVDLEVTDGTGPTGTDTIFKVVLVHNTPPTASFTIHPTSDRTTQTPLQFDASASSDPEGGTLEVRWDWDNDGTYDTAWSAAKTATHTFSVAGHYTVLAQVRDPVQLTGETVRYLWVYEEGTAQRAYLPLVSR